MIALRGQIKQVQGLKGKLSKPTGTAKSDRVSFVGKLIKTKLAVKQIVYESEES